MPLPVRDRLPGVRRISRHLYRVDTVRFASSVALDVFMRAALCPDGVPKDHDINDLAKESVIQVGVVMESIRGIGHENPRLVSQTMAAVIDLTATGERGEGWPRKLAQSTLLLLNSAPEIYEACGRMAVGTALSRTRRTAKKHTRIAKERRHVVRQ